MPFNNKFIQQRIQKAKQLKEAGFNPYQNLCDRNITLSQFKDVNSDIQSLPNRRDENRQYIVAGRIKLFRIMGKASFLTIEDEDDTLQIYLARDNLPEGLYNDIIKKFVEIGDIIEVGGYPFVTNKGELSLHASRFKLLTKAIAPLPEKFHGITDKEMRYRKRYLDLIMNGEVKKTFKMRSKIISLTRRFFEEKGFLEVETPMMHPIAGGANAKPFVTHHNALDVDRYLRIAPELYLKRLIVGGFESVFEINRNFRNEGMDATHNPEFTSIEFYWAYKTYKDLILLTKEYLLYLIEKMDLPFLLPYGKLEINFNNFQEIPLIESLSKIGGIDETIVNDKQKILDFLKQNNLEANTNMTLGQLQGRLFDEFVEDKLIDPTFITEYPVDISPLARRDDNNPNITQRFELFAAGREIANAFSELNDPLDQLERFKQQIDAKDAWDDEAHEMDQDFVEALSYGMAPTAGEGIGIDRLVMLLCNEHSIRDVLLFPAMRPVITENTNQQEG